MSKTELVVKAVRFVIASVFFGLSFLLAAIGLAISGLGDE